LHDCAKAGPELCALAKRRNEDPFAIEDRLERFFHSLVKRPLAGTFKGRPGYITSGAARGLLFLSLEIPLLQPRIARAIADAIDDRNATMLISYTLQPIGHTPAHSQSDDLSRLAVTCADSPYKPAPTAEDIADELIAGLEHTSSHFGASPIASEPDGGCQFWPTRGRTPERFTGPWNASLEYPLLIVGNTVSGRDHDTGGSTLTVFTNGQADPITPLSSALLLNHHMPHSSRLLIQDGPGHCSLQLPSICTIKVVREYWAGNPPKNG
jgi:hypothetical protein